MQMYYLSSMFGSWTCYTSTISRVGPWIFPGAFLLHTGVEGNAENPRMYHSARWQYWQKKP